MNLPSEITDEFIAEIKRSIQEVADFIRDQRRTFDQGKVEHKGPSDLVSYVDRQAESMLRSAFEAILPGSGFIGEESGSHHVHAEWRWIVDPLDGTTNFIHNIPVYCVSVALQFQDETLLGIVHDVPRGEVFWAVKGKGAFLGEERIQVSKVKAISDALLGTGFPPARFDTADDYLAAIKEFMTDSHGIRRLGSAAIDLAYVACGRLDGFFEIGLKPWDVAAGALIVLEAGGAVTAIVPEADFLFGKQIVVSNSALQQAMLHVLRRHLVH